MATLGLHCCIQTFSSCGKWGLLFISMRASHGWFLLSQGMGSRCLGFGSCGLWALEHRLSNFGALSSIAPCMQNLLRPGIKIMSYAFTGNIWEPSDRTTRKVPTLCHLYSFFLLWWWNIKISALKLAIFFYSDWSCQLWNTRLHI